MRSDDLNWWFAKILQIGPHASDARSSAPSPSHVPLQQITHILQKRFIKGICFIFFPPTMFQQVYSCCFTMYRSNVAVN